MELTTFSTILTQLLKYNDKSLRSLVNDMNNHQDVSISYPAFVSYKNYDVVPSFEKASIILNYFNYDITNQELTDILEYSRNELKKLKSDDVKDIRQGIRLSPSYFGIKETEDLEVILQKRINELNLEKNTINTYISELIRIDLETSGYIQKNGGK